MTQLEENVVYGFSAKIEEVIVTTARNKVMNFMILNSCRINVIRKWDILLAIEEIVIVSKVHIMHPYSYDVQHNLYFYRTLFRTSKFLLSLHPYLFYIVKKIIPVLQY